MWLWVSHYEVHTEFCLLGCDVMLSGKKYTTLLEESENGDSNFFKIFIIYFGLSVFTSQETVIFASKITYFTLIFTEIGLSWECPFILNFSLIFASKITYFTLIFTEIDINWKCLLFAKFPGDFLHLKSYTAL